MGDAVNSDTLKAAGLKHGFQVFKARQAPSRSGLDLRQMGALLNILSPVGPMPGELWKVLSLLVRYGDNVSAAGRDLNPKHPENGRRQVTRCRKKLMLIALEVLKRAAFHLRKPSSPELDLLRRMMDDHKAGPPLEEAVVLGPGWAALRKSAVEIGLELLNHPETEPFGWAMIRAAAELGCPTPKKA